MENGDGREGGSMGGLSVNKCKFRGSLLGGAVFVRVGGKKYMKQFLMHHVTACNYLDMDEVTFEGFIIPLVTVLKFGEQSYFITSELEDAVGSLMAKGIAYEYALHLVD